MPIILNPFVPRASEEYLYRQIRDLKSENGNLLRLQEEREAETKSLRKELQRLQNEHENEVERLTKSLQTAERNAKQREQSLNEDHGRVLEQLSKTHVTKVSEQHQAHKKITQDMHVLLEETNEALLTRDDEMYQAMIFTASGLPRKPDDKIRDQVLELHRAIEELSQINWKSSSETWMDGVLQIIGNQQHGQRLTKKAIVQDLIWSLLFKKIFCSPFRMFGEEGTVLERAWNEQCGKPERSSEEQIYTWPSPSVRTERWRYMTTKECREVLTSPISHVDKRAAIKHGFKTSQDELLNMLKNDLARVLQLTEQEVQLLQKLAKRAATTWLDFSMHRCRIVVRPTDSMMQTTAQKLSTLQKRSVALTLLPTVGRYGNVKGMELDRFTTIKGCEGNTLNYVNGPSGT